MSTRGTPKPPDPVSGSRRPLPSSSSPSAKDDSDTQQAKKKVRPLDFQPLSPIQDVDIEDVSTQDISSEQIPTDTPMKGTIPNARTERRNFLLEENTPSDDWYVAESDSEDVAADMREEDDMLDEDDNDPLCPSILFSATEKSSFRRAWRSALVVRGLGR
ncbi:hypothetical protein LINGRAHAP2_LOCUS30230 [Linum grandiflorum]